jgi:hypothetical protein
MGLRAPSSLVAPAAVQRGARPAKSAATRSATPKATGKIWLARIFRSHNRKPQRLKVVVNGFPLPGQAMAAAYTPSLPDVSGRKTFG